jgi:hypothetical protein
LNLLNLWLGTLDQVGEQGAVVDHRLAEILRVGFATLGSTGQLMASAVVVDHLSVIDG